MKPKNMIREAWFPLSADERQAEQSCLARLALSSASFVGTPREGYDAMTAKTPMAEGVIFEPVQQNEVQGWWVRPVF